MLGEPNKQLKKRVLMAKFGQHLYRLSVSPESLFIYFYSGPTYQIREGFTFGRSSFEIFVFDEGLRINFCNVYFELPKSEVKYSADVIQNGDLLRVNVSINL